MHARYDTDALKTRALTANNWKKYTSIYCALHLYSRNRIVSQYVRVHSHVVEQKYQCIQVGVLALKQRHVLLDNYECFTGVHASIALCGNAVSWLESHRWVYI